MPRVTINGRRLAPILFELRKENRRRTVFLALLLRSLHMTMNEFISVVSLIFTVIGTCVAIDSYIESKRK